MGGCRCSYRECSNTTKTENLHFFHYPVKQKERCKQWIENAQKPQFCNLEEDQLRNKVVCDQHFEDKWFPNPQKKRLLQGAIPTLPGKYILELTYDKSVKEEAEGLPMFVPQDQDIQVLPANEDGTVFLLDTDTMFTKSQKIESYVYQNGKLLPSTLVSSFPAQSLKSYSLPKVKEGVGKKEIIKEVTVQKQPFVEPHTEMEPGEILVKTEIPDYSEKNYDSQNKSIEHEADYEVMPKRVATEAKVLQNVDEHQKYDVNLEKSYLRKIKQHSRDIASIKKLLKEKALADIRPNIGSVVNFLKEQLPPSLFTVVMLNLNQECDLTDDDVDFFTMVHKSSPEVYQLLSDKFKWILPSVDVVDSLD